MLHLDDEALAAAQAHWYDSLRGEAFFAGLVKLSVKGTSTVVLIDHGYSSAQSTAAAAGPSSSSSSMASSMSCGSPAPPIMQPPRKFPVPSGARRHAMTTAALLVGPSKGAAAMHPVSVNADGSPAEVR